MRFRGIIFVFALVAPILASADALYPKLFFEHGVVFDMNCPENPKRPLTSEMKRELKARLPEVQKVWDKEGPALMDAVVSMFGLGFGRREETVSLVACGLMAPMSHPLLFRYRDYLTSVNTPVKPDFYFVSEVFHEMLHRFLTTNFPYDPDAPMTPLEKKYEKEDHGVQSHIFLLAIQKAVYLKLGKKSELDKIIPWDSEHAPSYKRSWEIVNKEGPDAFIADLKKQLADQKPKAIGK